SPSQKPPPPPQNHDLTSIGASRPRKLGRSPQGGTHPGGVGSSLSPHSWGDRRPLQPARGACVLLCPPTRGGTVGRFGRRGGREAKPNSCGDLPWFPPVGAGLGGYGASAS